MTTGSNQRSLLTNVHPGDTIVVKAFIDILEHYLLLRQVIDQVGYLRNQFIYVESCDVVIG